MDAGRTGPIADLGGWPTDDPVTIDGESTMLPCVATDSTTGFALAAGVMRAIDALLDDGLARRVDASLCQTAGWILQVGRLTVGSTTWRKSVFPDKNAASYLLSMKQAVRQTEGLVEDESVEIRLRLVVE